MTINTIQTSFAGGEISPQLFGHVDLAKYKNGASTCRNMFEDYRGGASSRAGLAYVGMCKQGAPNSGGTATANPPRDITFQFSLKQGYALEFGDQYMRIKSNGAYVIETPKTITGITKANPGVFTAVSHGFSVGDWIYISGVKGMTNFNGLIWIVNTTPTGNTFTVQTLFGTPVNTTSFSTYTSSGTAARIYTVVSPYAAIDLPYLKFTQSADTMTLCCVNQDTGTEYPSYELVRNAATNWTFTQDVFAASIAAPTGLGIVAASSTTPSTWYSYVVTAVDRTTGDESVASAEVQVLNNDLSINAGSNTVFWGAVANASSYNVYRAVPSYNVGVPVGTAHGYVGSSFGGSFVDTNIIADFTRVPPTHENPFAKGRILFVTPTAAGSGYSQATVGYIITTAGGTGFVGTPVITNGTLAGFIVDNEGQGYLVGDTIAITDSGAGTGATATLTIGPNSGTYPSVPAYYQQRRVYANTQNQPDTYFMSQPGSYNNFDSAIPTVDDDAITGAPWAQQINGIQFMVPVQSNLVVLTGSGAWSVNGGNNAAITPSSQTATAQAYNGCSATVPPIVVNYDILYVQAKGSIVRDLSYNFFVNIYTGTDLTVLSNHLFADKQILQWAYCEEPYKLVWAVRDDGILLCLTYLKEQDVYAWTRHDTNGLFVSACSVTEPPVDALYTIVQRFINGKWVYYSERMNNRNWQNVEDCFCVDAGLSYPMASPNATLFPGATVVGVSSTWTTDQNAFASTDVGSIIRADGGKGLITAFINAKNVTVTVTQELTTILLDDELVSTPVPAVAGSWTVSVPTTVVTGLNHLEGKTVSILADGSVEPQQVVTNGSVTLQHSASAITIGLPYVAQAQTMYLDVPTQGGTVQGKRKDIQSVTVRVKDSRGWSVGTNQPDQSTQPNGATVEWTNMKEVKQRNALVNAGSAIPLFTGDLEPTLVPGDWNTKGQVAIQQIYPLPLNVTALVPNVSLGDTSG